MCRGKEAVATLRVWIIAIGCLGFVATHAYAFDWEKVIEQRYVNIGGGPHYPDESNVRGASNTQMTFSGGYSFSSALGYRSVSKRNVRMELEASYRLSKIDSFGTANNGDLHGFALMANMFYDIRNESFITPYMGLGLGLTHMRLDQPATLNADDSHDTVGAYQLIAGIAYDPKPQSDAIFHVNYRYFGTITKPEFEDSVSGLSSSYEYTTHVVELGMRLNF